MSAAPRTISCLVCFGKDQPLQPWEYESRPLGANDVEIKISHCGICGSDTRKIDTAKGVTFPMVPGHEIVGVVTQAGPDVTELSVGDRVGVGASCLACFNKDDAVPCCECANGEDAYCDRSVLTYNSKYPDGATSYGGYADYVRVSSTHAFKIPENIPSDVAGPLLCAGVTMYTPMKEAGVKAGDCVGVVGIGGLGHLGIQFAKAMGATPVAFSRSANKEAEVRALGAEEFVNTSDPKQVESAMNSLDVLIITATGENMPYNEFLGFLRKRGTCVLVGIPNDQVMFFPMFLVAKGIKLCGSAIGSVGVIKEMLQVASEKNVRPVVQKLPMAEANKGLDMVRNNTVRYRVVLEN